MKKMNECLYIEKDMNKCPNFAPWYPDKKDGRCLWVDMDNKKVCVTSVLVFKSVIF